MLISFHNPLFNMYFVEYLLRINIIIDSFTTVTISSQPSYICYILCDDSYMH